MAQRNLKLLLLVSYIQKKILRRQFLIRYSILKLKYIIYPFRISTEFLFSIVINDATHSIDYQGHCLNVHDILKDKEKKHSIHVSKCYPRCFRKAEHDLFLSKLESPNV